MILCITEFCETDVFSFSIFSRSLARRVDLDSDWLFGAWVKLELGVSSIAI